MTEFREGSRVVRVKAVAGFLVIFEGPSLQIIPFCFLRLLICQFGSVAPFSVPFIISNLSIRFRDGTAFHQKTGGKEDAQDRTSATRAVTQSGFYHPLSNLKAFPAMIAAFVRVLGLIPIGWHKHP